LDSKAEETAGGVEEEEVGESLINEPEAVGQANPWTRFGAMTGSDKRAWPVAWASEGSEP